jgi:hypothetical protein
VERESAVTTHEMAGQTPGLDQPDAGEHEKSPFPFDQLQGQRGGVGVGGPGVGLDPGQKGLHPVALGLPYGQLGGLPPITAFVSYAHDSSLFTLVHATEFDGAPVLTRSLPGISGAQNR